MILFNYINIHLPFNKQLNNQKFYLMKKIIKLLIPPLLKPSFIKNIFLNLIRDENKFEYDKGPYNRSSFILRCLAHKDIQNCKYLEIGTCDDLVFNDIPLNIENKIGVDPEKGGTLRMTSDEFFSENKQKFDVIFIDGLHEYAQCKKDLLNSIKYLNHNGVILMHDCLPRNSFEEAVPRKQSVWNGDVWKVIAEVNNSLGLDYVIANIDRGVGIIIPKKNYEFKDIIGIEQKRFEDYINIFYPKFNVVSPIKALKFIDSNLS